jgi:hypothetical protein
MPTKSLTRQLFSSWTIFWGQKPEHKRWMALPICYTVFLQLITGLPKPDALRRFDGNELLIRFSEELFDYPYWLQDLSHLPLFFVLAWLWSWYLGPVERIGLASGNKALLFSLVYGCINELTQAFIPERFPSLGDLAMNAIGVTLGIFAHARLSKVLKDTRATAPKD